MKNLLRSAALLLLLASPSSLFSETPSLPDYNVGDQAVAEVVTPVQLIVIDPERTEVLRQKEAQRTPAIFRFYPNVIDEAEAALRSAFHSTREKFLTALEANYKRRRLTAQALTYPRFQRFVDSFQKQHKAFPLSTNLVQLWARGESDEPIQAEFVTRLRDAQGQHVRPDVIPPEARFGSPQVRLVSLKRPEVPVDLETAEKFGTAFMRSNLVALTRARNDVLKGFAPTDQAAAKFVAGFVRPNCLFEEELTHQSRLKRTEAMWSADHYEPGQVIVKAGEVVDARIKAALAQLKAKTTVDQVKALAAEEKLKAQETMARLEQQAALAQATAQESTRRNRWLLGALLFFVLACVAVFWRLSGRKAPESLLPARLGPGFNEEGLISYPNREETVIGPLDPSEAPPAVAANTPPWQQRALDAEERADKAAAVVRARLIPHLARWMMDKLVRRILSQRAHLLEAQQKAEVEVAELERRLTNLHAPLEERLLAYEKRIGELEKELAAKGAENRELIQAKIMVARKRLELERAKDRIAFN